MFLLFRHLFIPHFSNNHRAKILHHKSLFVLTLLIIILSAFTFSFRKAVPSVLGVATNISVEDLLTFTNQKRAEHGLGPLSLNNNLSKAAGAKAANMFSKDYWAHNAPDGTTPWVFFQDAGYNYIYAGENLAKDFDDAKGVVDAWMASPSHKENMLSNRYSEVGFAVVNGMLTGSETTLVVEMLGTKQSPAPRAADQVSLRITPTPTPMVHQSPALVEPGGLSLVAGISNAPLINSRFFTQRIAFTLLGILILAFFLDMVYIERKKLIRLVGHNADHVIFLAGAIILMLIFVKGVIL